MSSRLLPATPAAAALLKAGHKRATYWYQYEELLNSLQMFMSVKYTHYTATVTAAAETTTTSYPSHPSTTLMKRPTDCIRYLILVYAMTAKCGTMFLLIFVRQPMLLLLHRLSVKINQVQCIFELVASNAHIRENWNYITLPGAVCMHNIQAEINMVLCIHDNWEVNCIKMY